jgi:L-ribulokinase
MQLFADISGLEVRVPASNEVPARGSALFGAVAGGAFDHIDAAVAATEPETAHSYQPDGAAKRTDDRLYAVWRGLHDVLGRERVELLHSLKRIRLDAGMDAAQGAPVAQGTPA